MKIEKPRTDAIKKAGTQAISRVVGPPPSLVGASIVRHWLGPVVGLGSAVLWLGLDAVLTWRSERVRRAIRRVLETEDWKAFYQEQMRVG